MNILQIDSFILLAMQRFHAVIKSFAASEIFFSVLILKWAINSTRF